MKKIVFTSIVVLFILVACSQAESIKTVPSCIAVKVTECDSFDPRGTITNSCDQNIWMAKLIISALDSDQNILVSDEEYVESLAQGASQNFEAVFDYDYGKQVKYCKVVIESVVFK